MPSMPGMLRSRITMGANSRRSSASASSPLVAVATSYPAAPISSRMCATAMSSSSTTSTRGAAPNSAGWIWVMTESSADAVFTPPSVAVTAPAGQLQCGARLAQLHAQRVRMQAGVNARDQFRFAHTLGEVVVDAGAIAALEVEVVLARRQHDHVRVAGKLGAEFLREFDAIHDRHVPVDDHHRHDFPAQHVQRLRAV